MKKQISKKNQFNALCQINLYKIIPWKLSQNFQISFLRKSKQKDKKHRQKAQTKRINQIQNLKNKNIIEKLHLLNTANLLKLIIKVYQNPKHLIKVKDHLKRKLSQWISKDCKHFFTKNQT